MPIRCLVLFTGLLASTASVSTAVLYGVTDLGGIGSGTDFPVPEPSTLALLVMSLAAGVLFVRAHNRWTPTEPDKENT